MKNCWPLRRPGWKESSSFTPTPAFLTARMRIYQHAGYFDPSELEDLIAMAYASGVTGQQHLVLSNFANRYAT